jgi:hypothetical protein
MPVSPGQWARISAKYATAPEVKQLFDLGAYRLVVGSR